MLYVYGVIGLLASNLILLSLIFYMIYNRGRAEHKAESARANEYETRLKGLISVLKAELSAASKAGEELRKRGREYAANEARLMDKHRVFDGMIKNARAASEEITAAAGSHRKGEMYSRAMSMIRTGMPMDEISRQFGLLNGEAELISSINSFRSN